MRSSRAARVTVRLSSRRTRAPFRTGQGEAAHLRELQREVLNPLHLAVKDQLGANRRFHRLALNLRQTATAKVATYCLTTVGEDICAWMDEHEGLLVLYAQAVVGPFRRSS
jgi:hypothetical protein